MIIVKGRELLIPENERYIGTNYDAGMENRLFRIPRYSQSGTDLSDLTFKINLIFDGDPLDRAEMTKAVDDDYIYLTWTVTEAQVAVTGTVFVCVTGNDTNDTVKWSSFQAPFYTEKSLGDDIDTAYHDLVNKVAKEITDRESAVAAEKSAREAADTTLQQNINAEASARAAGDAAVNARIDNIVAQSGDDITEIVDARTGADSTVHASLKARLDSEHTDIKNDLGRVNDAYGDATGLLHIQINYNGKCIDTSGDIGSVVDLTEISSTGFGYAIVPCVAGDTFNVSAYGGNRPRTWCFVDSDYKILSHDTAVNNRIIQAILTAPDNAAYLIINNRSSNANSYKMTIQSFDRIPLDSGDDLNNVLTPGEYYTATDAIARTIINKPDEVTTGFKLNVDYNTGRNSSSKRQILITRNIYAQHYIYVRTYYNNTFSGWFRIATADTATLINDGLMSAADKRNLVNVRENARLENALYPSVNSTLGDLLEIEKTIAIFHDNFARENNSTAIGNNGSGNEPMNYSDMASSDTEAQNIAVGINNKKAVASNPYSVGSGAKRIKYYNVNGRVVSQRKAYKASIGYGSKGCLVINPTDVNNYVMITCTPNDISLNGVGTFSGMTTQSMTHNGDVHNVDVYVYPDKIDVYAAGVYMFTADDYVQTNGYVGLYFDSDNIDTISYTSFVIKTPEIPFDNGLDNAIEYSDHPERNLTGPVQTADESYGVTFNTDVTRFSVKSLRFEQRKADSGTTYRSEIIPRTFTGINYPLRSMLLDFDLFFPEDYDYDSTNEIILQMHNTPDGVNADGLYPNIALSVQKDHIYLLVRSASDKIQTAQEAESTSFDMGLIKKGEWTHVTLFFREGYMPEHYPVTAVWLDGALKALTRIPNAYNTTRGSYLKIGMYKHAWQSQTTETNVRVIYYDNVHIWL